MFNYLANSPPTRPTKLLQDQFVRLPRPTLYRKKSRL